MHILGYNIDYNNQNLNKALEEIHTNNINNLKNIVEYLKLFNITLPEDELNEIYTRIGNIGRPDIAKLLIKHGYVTTVKEAFDCYLVEAFNKIRHKNKGLKYPEILKLIIDANGIPVLAHPKSLELSNDELDELIKHMVSLGLKGIETIHSDITSKEHVFYMQLVDKYHLTYSGGSDYHGEQVKPDIELGHGRNNIYIEEVSVLNLIKKH